MKNPISTKTKRECVDDQDVRYLDCQEPIFSHIIPTSPRQRLRHAPDGRIDVQVFATYDNHDED